MSRRLVLAAALAASALAVPAAASAHTPAVSIDCVGTGRASVAVVDVTGTKYGNGANVTVSVDGHTLYSRDFVGDFHSANRIGSGYVNHSVRVAFTAPDDPDGSRAWTRTFDLVSPPCKTPPPHHRVVAPSAAISPTCGDPKARFTFRAGSAPATFTLRYRDFTAGWVTRHRAVAAHQTYVTGYKHVLGDTLMTIRAKGKLLASRTMEAAGWYGRCPA